MRFNQKKMIQKDKDTIKNLLMKNKVKRVKINPKNQNNLKIKIVNKKMNKLMSKLVIIMNSQLGV